MISDLCHHHLHVMAIPINIAPARRQAAMHRQQTGSDGIGNNPKVQTDHHGQRPAKHC